MSWIFNPPPGWPPQPEGWVPPPGWAPDPRWPPAPAGWQFWVPGQAPPAGGPPGQGPSPYPGPADPAPPHAAGRANPYPAAHANPYPAAHANPYPAAHANPYPAGQASPYPAGQADPYPPAQADPYPAAQADPYAAAHANPYPAAQDGGYPPLATTGAGQPAPDRAPAATAGRSWFTRWWVIAGLIALLVLGVAIGFGGTRGAMELRSDDEPARTGGTGSPDGGAAGDPELAAPATPVASQAPAATASPRIALPTVSPPASEGVAGQLCADVALIMITMVTATAEAEDFEEYLDSVVAARRTAAEEVRALAEDPDHAPDRTALEEFAGGIDASAQMVEEDPGDQGTFEDSFDRVSDAYQTFTDDNC